MHMDTIISRLPSCTPEELKQISAIITTTERSREYAKELIAAVDDPRVRENKTMLQPCRITTKAAPQGGPVIEPACGEGDKVPFPADLRFPAFGAWDGDGPAVAAAFRELLAHLGLQVTLTLDDVSPEQDLRRVCTVRQTTDVDELRKYNLLPAVLLSHALTVWHTVPTGAKLLEAEVYLRREAYMLECMAYATYLHE